MRLQTTAIYAAASSLDVFTAAELASRSGTSVETVRSLIRRHDRHFEVVDRQHSGSRGRPASRYRLVHDALPPGLAGLGQGRVAVVEERSELEDLRLTVRAGELALRKALRAEVETVSRYARLALRAAERARAAHDEVGSGEPDLLPRIELTWAFASVLAEPAASSSPTRTLDRLVESVLASVVDREPRRALELLNAAAASFDQPPAVAVLVEADSQSPGSQWRSFESPLADRTLWAPGWAEKLTLDFCFSGAVVDVRQDDHTLWTQIIEPIRLQHIPVAVWGIPDDDLRVARHAGLLGLPISMPLHAAAEVVAMAIEPLPSLFGGSDVDEPS